MKALYNITSHTRMLMNKHEILNDKIDQQWELTFEKQTGTYDFYLTTEVKAFPKNTSPAMQPLFNLLDIVVKPSAKISLLVDGEGKIKRLINKEEIIASWKECRNEITINFGDDENIRQMMKNLDTCFDNYSLEIYSSLYYFILLSPWKNRKKNDFTTRSTVCEGGSVDIEIHCKEAVKNEDGKTSWTHQGTGYLNELSKFKKIYESQLKQYAHAEFNYKYAFQTEYVYGQKRDGFAIFEKSVTNIQEQASDGYEFFNTIEFNLIEE